MNPIYINTDEKLIRNGGRSGINTNVHGKTLYKTLSKMFDKFASAYVREFPSVGTDTTSPLSEVNGNICINDDVELYFEFFESVIQSLEKDLMKVAFDIENLECVVSQYAEDGGNEKDFLGYHVLENGFEFIGFLACGDWEEPVYFIVYHDGKKLRGYIPVCGNTYDTDFGCAFGSEFGWQIDLSSPMSVKAISAYKKLDPNFDVEDLDNETAVKMFLLKHNHIPLDDPMYDECFAPELLAPECSLMLKDISSRIVVS